MVIRRWELMYDTYVRYYIMRSHVCVCDTNNYSLLSVLMYDTAVD